MGRLCTKPGERDTDFLPPVQNTGVTPFCLFDPRVSPRPQLEEQRGLRSMETSSFSPIRANIAAPRL